MSLGGYGEPAGLVATPIHELLMHSHVVPLGVDWGRAVLQVLEGPMAGLLIEVVCAM